MEKRFGMPRLDLGGAIDSPMLAAARLIATDIKLSHSIFALPFAVLASFLAATSLDGATWPPFLGKLALVVVCMVLARTWAMLFNRLADRRFDAGNPRTARRVFASGALDARTGWAVALGCAVAFVGATSLFRVLFGNPWPLWLSVPVLAWIAFYSLTKRFTALCHVFLGGALAASPVAAAIAIDPSYLGASWTVWWLAAFVLCWVAGFDVIYALADQAFDRGAGLSSIPARLGTRGALWVSRGLHVGGYACLVMAARSEPRFSWIFAGAVALVGGLLALEHAIVAKRGEAGLDMAFFTVNGVVSCVLGLLGVADTLW